MIDTSFLSLKSSDTADEQAKRRRAAEATQLFGGAASGPNGRVVNFNAPSDPRAPATKSSGLASAFDFYATSHRAEMDLRDERAAKMDRLPVKVQRLAQEQGITDLALLQIIGAVVARNAIMGADAKFRLHASDLGRAIGITSQKADALLDDASRRGWIERFDGNHVRSRL